MPALLDKLLHFAVGIATGVVFWWVLERNHRNAAAAINPISLWQFLVSLLAMGFGYQMLTTRRLPF